MTQSGHTSELDSYDRDTLGYLGAFPQIGGALQGRVRDALLRGARLHRENVELQAEVERLRRWKAEASEVILGLQDVGKALGLRPGERITGQTATEAAQRLTARAEAAEAQVAEAGAEALVAAADEVRRIRETGDVGPYTEGFERWLRRRAAMAGPAEPETTEDVPADIEQPLADLYDGPGVRIWWTSRNTMLDGRTPRDVYRESAEGAKAVIDLANHLADGNW